MTISFPAHWTAADVMRLLGTYGRLVATRDGGYRFEPNYPAEWRVAARRKEAVHEPQ